MTILSFGATYSAEKAWAEDAPKSGPNFSYLPQKDAKYLKKIFEGDERTGGPASNRVGRYLAFHRAFSASCQTEIDDSWSEFTLTRESELLNLREVESVWLEPQGFDEFYLAAVSMLPVILKEYDRNPLNDFSVHRVYSIHVESQEEQQANFAKILKQEGCSSDIAKKFRNAMSDHLPQTQVGKGESTVTMSTMLDGRITFTLDSPYDPDSMKSSRETASSDSGMYPSETDHGGRTLSDTARSVSPGMHTPNERDIEQALEERLEEAFGSLDRASDGCNTYRRDNDPSAALNCLFTNGGTINSRSANVQIQSVVLDHCTAMNDSRVDAICRYRVSATMTGTGTMQQVASIFNMSQAFNEWAWASFQRDGRTWQLVESWNECTRTEIRTETGTQPGYNCRRNY